MPRKIPWDILHPRADAELLLFEIGEFQGPHPTASPPEKPKQPVWDKDTSRSELARAALPAKQQNVAIAISTQPAWNWSPRLGPARIVTTTADFFPSSFQIF